ncbi:MAG: SusC/RagA family TonB-linked outer membrane protein [Candidatus Cyclobacteriaceae bacterium M3_2C_046]
MKKLILLVLIFLVLQQVLLAQKRNISGLVKSMEDDQALPGVNVVIKGTTQGTVTNLEGQYQIEAGTDDILVFSSVGYTSEEIEVGNRSVIDLVLMPDIQQLQELVVVGYGSQEKKDITGAMSSVSAKEIMEVPVMNAQQALQGRAPGVDVVNLGNRPGQGVQVRIRGRRSFVAGNEPLFVVDGIPFAGSINDINPADIESMEILKDASATAIYGSRGANGVVLITTKRGTKGKTVVSYDGYYGPSSAYGKVDMMNGEEFAELKRESRRTTGQYPSDGIDPILDENLFEAVEWENIQKGYSSTDYQELILQSGHQQSHQLGISGGSDKTVFNVSLSMFNEEGITPGQDFTRFNARINLDHEISPKFKVGTSTLLGYSIQNWGSNPWGGALAENPLGKPFNDDGTLRFRPTTDGLRTNPLSDLVEGAFVDDRRRYRLFTSLYGRYQVTKDLNFQVNFGPDVRIYRRGLFQGRYTGARAEGAPLARNEHEYIFNYTLENILNYNKKFDIHSLDATALFSVQQQKEEDYNAQALDQPYESSSFYNLSNSPLIDGYDSDLREWGLLSYMGRLQYGLLDKYLFTFTVRADGNSRLAEGNKWGVFPSGAFAWRIIDEPFMQRLKFVQELKFRASYGQVGNTDNLRPYLTQGGLAGTKYAFLNAPAFGFRPNDIPNPDLRWESTTTFNLGLDFGLFDGRLSGSAEFYIANTNDLIMNRQLPWTSGFGDIQENVGKTRNTGFEISLSTVNLNTPSGFRWSTDFIWNTNKEEIVELYGGTVDDIGNSWFIGHPMTVYFDYEKVGIWQLEEEERAKVYAQLPGQIKLRDQDDNDKIDGDDRIILGNDQPDWVGSINNRIEYKGIDFSMLVFARWGQMVFNNFYTGNNSLFGRYNNLDVDYWTPSNPTNANPRPNEDQEFPIYGGTRGYMDGSFLKVRNMTLGYLLPDKILEKTPFSRVRVYANALQPWIYSPVAEMKNIDPEITRTPEGSGAREGAERTARLEADVPSSRMFIFGLNVNF